MKKNLARIFFDADDYKLLGIVNDVLQRRLRPQSISSLMTSYMHPRGIKEMAAPAGLRIAHAIISLLGSLESGQANDRIIALRCLMDEVFSSSTTMYRKNTARVLIQIMKELVRNEGNELKQLKLAHDFRMVSSGKPMLVRGELRKYFLLEMPEEWNQYSFDDHVHDANTKGRKSPTHLLLDAWIKGIRKLTVVYYNHVELEVVEELLEASAILDIHVRIGIEFSSLFRGRFVRFIWELAGFLDRQSLLQFVRTQGMQEVMDEGRQVSHYQQRYVFDVLEAFNIRHRLVMNEELGVQAEAIDREEFIQFVGAGQPSLLHLARYIQLSYCAALDYEDEHNQQNFAENPDKQYGQTRADKMRLLGMERIMDRYLLACHNPELRNPAVPQENMPPLMRLGPPELLGRLSSLHANSRFTLNLYKLSLQDILELLYICEGRISHLESFNLKDASYGLPPLHESRQQDESAEAKRDYQVLNTLQDALNDNNVIALKRVIRAIIWNFDQSLLQIQQKSEQYDENECGSRAQLQSEATKMDERKTALLNILLDIESLHKFYSPARPLGSRIGSGSTGQSQLRYGMGLAVLSTLPSRVRRSMVKESNKGGGSKLIPVTAWMVHHQHRYEGEPNSSRWLQPLLSQNNPAGHRQDGHWSSWTLDHFQIHPGKEGNIVALGGLRSQPPLEIGLRARQDEKIGQPIRYLNSNIRNALKILLGFIPAFLTFALTKDWWLLAYGGAFIWFGITGIRNIIQAVLGGGGLKRSPFLPWSALVNWSRIADSLFFTGLSVPLLDYLVKTLLLQNQCDVTVASNPLVLYAVMSIANSIYISTHNILRGLPKAAVVGNLFRSILAIPLAVLFNGIIAETLVLAGVSGVDEELQKWAAVISKLASDCVAAVIEGLADRQNNIRIRMMDYREKLAQLFDVFSRLDVLFPEEDVLDLLERPQNMMSVIHQNGQGLEKIFIVNALDLMYIWMYQPRAAKALQQTVVAMSREEWLIFYRSQLILKHTREISQMFVDGLVGKNFAKALSFYLDRSESYLRDMEQLGQTRELLWKRDAMRHHA